jgi:plastocyanin
MAMAGLSLVPARDVARAAPEARPPLQGIQVSGIITAGSGTCFPDAVLVDCNGTVLEQLKGPSGSAFFVPYYRQWVTLNGARQTCTVGDPTINVVTMQVGQSPCGGAQATNTPPVPPGATATPPVPPGATPTPLPPVTVDVTARNNYFDPRTLTVDAGATVRWTNLGSAPHTVTLPGVFDSGTMNPAAVFSYTFNSPGIYNYYCVYHRYQGMTGQIVVRPGTVPPAGSTNVALGKPATASSSQPGFGPELAVDGSNATYWASLPGRDPYFAARNIQWIQVDLGASYSIAGMHMLWNSMRHARGYSVYMWSDYCRGWCHIGSTSYGDGDDTWTAVQQFEGRYFMLYLVNPYLIGGQYELLEWEIFSTGGGIPIQTTNLAAGKPVLAYNQDPAYPATNATDADVNTEWRSLPGLPTWIYVDLGAVYDIDRVILRWAAGLHATNHAIYIWNGYQWVAVYATRSGPGGDETIPLFPVRTRYVLLYAISGPANQVGLREFEVYQRGSGGTTGPTPPAPPLPPVPLKIGQGPQSGPLTARPQVAPMGLSAAIPSPAELKATIDSLGARTDRLPDPRATRE